MAPRARAHSAVNKETCAFEAAKSLFTASQRLRLRCNPNSKTTPIVAWLDGRGSGWTLALSAAADGNGSTRQDAGGPELTYTARPELRATLRLGAPLALAEIGWMSTYLVDAVMVGRLPGGAGSIAASSLGNTIFYAIVFFGVGLLYGLDTLVSQAFGRRDRQHCLFILAQSLWLTVLWVPATSLLLLAAAPVMRWDGIEPGLLAETMRYLHALQWSTLPLLLYMALRHYLQAVNRTVAIMVSLLTANLVNLLADWAFLFGHLGFRPMGLAGSGWATTVVRVYMLALLLAAFLWHLRRDGVQLHIRMFLPSLEPLRALLRLGWAPAIQTMMDLGVSTAQTLICGRLGAVALAINQVVLDVGAFVYMVPLGIGQGATAIRVGQSVGAGHRPGVRLATRVGSMLCIGLTGVAALAFLLIPRRLAGIYTIDPAVIAGSVAIFAIAASYQVFDAWEACLSGSLRGLGDTKTPMIAGVFWSWVIGLPLTWYLATRTPLGLAGLWIGRALPSILTAISVALLWRSRLDRLYPPPAPSPRSPLGATPAPKLA